MTFRLFDQITAEHHRIIKASLIARDAFFLSPDQFSDFCRMIFCSRAELIRPDPFIDQMRDDKSVFYKNGKITLFFHYISLSPYPMILRVQQDHSKRTNIEIDADGYRHRKKTKYSALRDAKEPQN